MVHSYLLTLPLTATLMHGVASACRFITSLLRADSNRSCACSASSPDVADAPSTSDAAGARSRRPSGQPPPPPPSGAGLIRKAVRYAEKKLSNLSLAMVELAILAALSAVGTIIEQDQVRCCVA